VSEDAVVLLGCKVRKDREVLKAVGRRRHPRREQWIKLREVEGSQGS
jgi:ribosomal protein L24E